MPNKCHLCGHQQLSSIIELGQQPLANKYPRKDQFSDEKFYPLSVQFCENCNNVQIDTVVSRKIMFEDYYYLSSVNPGLVRHFNDLAAKIGDARFVVDIGSNDGVLLKPLKDRNVKAVGVEPSINVSKIAADQGLTTICAFFDADTAAQIAETHGKADVIVASSVFTHLDEPHDFVEAVKTLLSEDGVFIIEVEYIGNIIEQTQFERFYLDRIFYYSLMSLSKFFNLHDMEVVDVEHIDPHGGSIRVTVARAGQAAPHSRVGQMLAEEQKTMNLSRLARFNEESHRQIGELRSLLQHWAGKGIKVAGYGAPARLSTICNFGDIGPDLVSYTVDDSPLKAGKFSPGTHIPIMARDHLTAERPDILLVFAYEYFRDIVEKIGSDYTYFMPIPPKEIKP